MTAISLDYQSIYNNLWDDIVKSDNKESIDISRSMLKNTLDTSWKRFAFLLFLINAVSLVAIVALPPPLNILTTQSWLDAIPEDKADRFVSRIKNNCADNLLGGKSFASEYWLARAGKVEIASPQLSSVTEPDPYSQARAKKSADMLGLPLQAVQERLPEVEKPADGFGYRDLIKNAPGLQSASESLDIPDEDLQLIRKQLSNCTKPHCSSELDHAEFEQIISTCSHRIAQTYITDMTLHLDEHQIEDRLPIILTLAGLAVFLACLSFLYTPTIGKVTSWIRNG
ncbi:MAG TPA: hypothetical protein VK959_10795 [Methylophilaceae bacterium]|uniref:hypothetical protein n=1 Tax=Methylobacillus sp. MM3 TaxID=1848039 RepID=UPI0007DFA908|nr:hypothetical protein [Methylobacillus sp. MM3]OAJ70934.1 hypothetical protein A7976_05650 [Methylobacillus sp. MM3]HSI23496.1 hypothetical protein [Methylophilaceae bacterium]